MDRKELKTEYVDLIVRSQFRADPFKTTPAKFTIPITPNIEGVHKAYLLNASIPNCLPNVQSWNNTLTITEQKSALSFQITVPVGIYTSDLLSTTLATLLTSKSVSSGNSLTYTITKPANPTWLMTIASTGAFKISYDESTSPLAYYIGFRPILESDTETAYGTSLTANYMPDLRGTATIYIFTNLCSHTIDESHNKTYLLNSVFVPSGYMSICTYSDASGEGFKCGDIKLDHLDIELRDQYDETIPLTMDWEMTIRLQVPWGTLKKL